MKKPSEITWIAVDWGTSSLRIFGLGQDNEIVSRFTSEQGMSGLVSTDYEKILLETITPWLTGDKPTEVIVCGMAGAKQGWQEAPYAEVPCRALNLHGLLPLANTDPRLSVTIIPGICQLIPPDVMRGEETQIAGFISKHKTKDSLLCLPGTHTKWVRLRDEKIISFSTHMSGELFALLSRHSILKHDMSNSDWDESVFLTAVNAGWNQSERLANLLFSIRARSLVDPKSSASGASVLSGMLIGAELAANCKSENEPAGDLFIISNGTLAERYTSAMRTLSIPHQIVDAESMTIAGLIAARRSLFKRW